MIVLTYCFFAFFFSVLNGARVGDLVLVSRNHHEKYLQRQIGVVKAVGYRVVVYLFRCDLFGSIPEGRSPEPLSYYFTTRVFDYEKLFVYNESHWKPELQAPNDVKIVKRYPSDLSGYEPAVKAHLPVDKYHRFLQVQKTIEKFEEKFGKIDVSEEGMSEELKIISFWMNLAFQVSFLKALPNLCPFKIESFIIMQGFSRANARFNGLFGIIRERQAEFTIVMIMDDDFKRFYLYEARDRQMRLATADDWHQETILDSARRGGLTRSRDSVFAYGPSELTDNDRIKLKQIKDYIGEFCENDGVTLFNDFAPSLRAKLLGAWINVRYGWHGMAYAFKCREQDRYNDVNNALNLLWDGIGAWKK